MSYLPTPRVFNAESLLNIPNLQQELADAGLTLDSLKDFKINLPQ